MFIYAQRNNEINVKEGIGAHEFSTFPKSLMENDKRLRYTKTKSDLMSELEKLLKKEDHLEPSTVKDNHYHV